MIAAGIQAGGEPNGAGAGTAGVPAVSGAIPGSAAAQMGASDNSAGFRSRWTSAIASLSFAPQTTAADAAPQHIPSSVPQQNCKASPEFRAAGRPKQPEKNAFAGTLPKPALFLTTQPNKGLSRVDRVDSSSTQKKKEIAGKTTTGDAGIPGTGFDASVAVTAPATVSAPAPPLVDESRVSAHPLNLSSTSANDDARVYVPMERTGNAESLVAFPPANTERRQPDAAPEVRSITNPKLPAGVDANEKMHIAESGPVSPATAPGDLDGISAFHGPQSDTGTPAEPHSATTTLATGIRPSIQPAGEIASVSRARLPNLSQKNDPLETSSALPNGAMDSPAQAGFRTNSPKSVAALNSSQPPAIKAARQNSADDSIRSERQPSPPAWSAATAPLVSDTGIARASMENPDAPGRAATATANAFTALDAARSSPPAAWIHAGVRHAEAGYLDPALGWIGVRADAVANGVHAALVPGSAEAAQILGTHLSGLNAWLSEQHGPPATVSMGTFDAGPGGQGSGINPGSQSNAGSSEHETPHPGRDDSAAASMPMRSVHVAEEVRPVANIPAAAGRYISVMA